MKNKKGIYFIFVLPKYKKNIIKLDGQNTVTKFYTQYNILTYYILIEKSRNN